MFSDVGASCIWETATQRSGEGWVVTLVLNQSNSGLLTWKLVGCLIHITNIIPGGYVVNQDGKHDDIYVARGNEVGKNPRFVGYYYKAEGVMVYAGNNKAANTTNYHILIGF